MDPASSKQAAVPPPKIEKFLKCGQCGTCCPATSYSRTQIKQQGRRKCPECVAVAVSTANAGVPPTAKHHHPPSYHQYHQPSSVVAHGNQATVAVAARSAPQSKKGASAPPAGYISPNLMTQLQRTLQGSECPLCGGRLSSHPHADGIFGRPDGSCEMKSFTWYKSNMLGRSDSFFCCPQHDISELPLPWGHLVGRTAEDLEHPQGLNSSGGEKRGGGGGRGRGRGGSNSDDHHQHNPMFLPHHLRQQLASVPRDVQEMILMSAMMGIEDQDMLEDFDDMMMMRGAPHGHPGGGGDDDVDFSPSYGSPMLGYSGEEVDELLQQGVKPWDDDADAVLGALHGEGYF